VVVWRAWQVMMNVVNAGVAAVLVCFVEDPAALRQTHPDYHQ
jgi:ATP-dependent Clp protease adapter protein ClpS